VAEAIANRLGRGITPVGPPDQLRQSVDVVTPDVVTIARKSLRLSQPQIVRAIRVSEERLDAIR
jgi:hypothetical protein